MTEKIKQWGLFLLPFPFFILFLWQSEAAKEGVRLGWETVVHAALPSLYVPLTLSRMIGHLYPKSGKTSAFFLTLTVGLIAGFPIGASMTGHFYRQGLFTKREAMGLLFCSNNAGAAFLLGYLGELFGQEVARRIFCGQALMAGLFFLPVFFLRHRQKEKSAPDEKELGRDVFLLSLSEGTEAFFRLSGCLIFFSFLSSALLAALPLSPQNGALLHLFLESVSGLERCTRTPDLPLPLSAAGCVWGGLSVVLQTKAVLKGTSLSVTPYLLGRLVMAAATYFLFQGVS